MHSASAAASRALAAEHGLGIIGLEGRGALGHQVVLNDGAHHAGRALGAQGQALLGLELGIGALGEDALEVGAGEHAEHLLAHDVGRLADAVDEDVDLLDGGRLDGLEAERLEHAGRDLLHLLPGAHLRADQVLGSLCLLCLHGHTFHVTRHKRLPLYGRPPKKAGDEAARKSLWYRFCPPSDSKQVCGIGFAAEQSPCAPI